MKGKKASSFIFPWYVSLTKQKPFMGILGVTFKNELWPVKLWFFFLLVEPIRNHWVHIPLVSWYPTSTHDRGMNLRCFVSILRQLLASATHSTPLMALSVSILPEGLKPCLTTTTIITTTRPSIATGRPGTCFPVFLLVSCFLDIWALFPSFLLPWLRRIFLLCFWGNSQCHSTFPNKNPCFVSPRSWSWPEKLDLIGHSTIWILFCDFWLVALPGSLHWHVNFSTVVM